MKKEINYNEKKGELIIKLSFKKRKYATEEKILHDGKVRHLIPKDIQKQFALIKSPEKPLSNIPEDRFQLSGTWVFKVVEPPKPVTPKPVTTPATKSRRSRRSVKKT